MGKCPGGLSRRGIALLGPSDSADNTAKALNQDCPSRRFPRTSAGLPGPNWRFDRRARSRKHASSASMASPEDDFLPLLRASLSKLVADDVAPHFGPHLAAIKLFRESRRPFAADHAAPSFLARLVDERLHRLCEPDRVCLPRWTDRAATVRGTATARDRRFRGHVRGCHHYRRPTARPFHRSMTSPVEKYFRDGLRRERLKSHDLRPRTDRRQLLAGAGADEDHQRPRRRLFERLEQAVALSWLK